MDYGKVNRLRRAIFRWGLWLVIRHSGRRRMPVSWRRVLRKEQYRFDCWIRAHYRNRPWRTRSIQGALVQPFQDLLNRPAGGEAYLGGVLFHDPAIEPTLRHFRGERAIDCPMTALVPGQVVPLYLSGRMFWCGPLAFHFGHQIADFGSRVLVASIDPRGGELLWCPWRSAEQWEELLQWQQFLLTYLNPSGKTHRICTSPLCVRDLVVVPQQARMRAAPTLAHLDALAWCERSLRPCPHNVVYVSRARYAPCTDLNTLLGGFAAEALLEKMLEDRGVVVIHPETLSLREQLEIYHAAEVLIVAEGSAQHGLELLGFNARKRVIVLCRRPQVFGMDWPLRARFPQVQMLEALISHWQAMEGVSWDGLAILDWPSIVKQLNLVLSRPLLDADVLALTTASENQLQKLASKVRLIPAS